ncbi:MAG: hypothetical protein E7356_00825 [Clostridiales bacterium]|nr:hypothetical protein [Clostridiales bacterium]
MWQEVVNLAISNGLFAVLFLGLLIYFLRDSSKREKKYQETILKLGNALEIVQGVKQDVEDIKEMLHSSSNIRLKE